MAVVPYTLEQAETDIADLRGQVSLLDEIIKFIDSAADWGPATGGAWLYSLAGHLKYAGTDGSAYDAGRLTQFVASNTAINTVGGATLLSAPVAIGSYRIHAVIFWTEGGAGGGQNFTLAGPSISNVHIAVNSQQMNAATSGNWAEYAGTLGTITSPAFGAATIITEQFDGLVTFTAAGTFTLSAAAPGGAGSPFTVGAQSFWDLMPVA